MADPRHIEKSCILIDVETQDSIEFQMMPDGISDAKSANYNHIEIVGRSHPVLGYSSSGPRTISFTLIFFGNPSLEDTTTVAKVSKNLKFLLSLVYPDYSSGVKPPHRCVLRLGNQVNMICVVSDVNINYRHLWDENGQPVYAEASVTCIEADPYPITFSTIRG